MVIKEDYSFKNCLLLHFVEISMAMMTVLHDNYTDEMIKECVHSMLKERKQSINDSSSLALSHVQLNERLVPVLLTYKSINIRGTKWYLSLLSIFCFKFNNCSLPRGCVVPTTTLVGIIWYCNLSITVSIS